MSYYDSTVASYNTQINNHNQTISECNTNLERFLVRNNVLPIFDTAGIVLQCHSVYNMVERKRVISHERLHFWKQDLGT